MTSHGSAAVRASAAFWVTLALSLVAGAGCGPRSKDAGSVLPVSTAPIVKVTRQTIVPTVQLSGVVSAAPDQAIRVMSEVPGRIAALLVAEGDTVQQGQVVAELDRQQLDEERRQAAGGVERARSALESATRDAERAESLFARGLIPRNDVESRRARLVEPRAALDEATAALSAATRNLEHAAITSPAAGQVVLRLVAPGDRVDGRAGPPIVEVANLAVVEMLSNIPAEHAASVRVGLPAAIVAAALPGRLFAAHVTAITAAADSARGPAVARILIPNPENLLALAMPLQAQIDGPPHMDALVVPASALVRDEGKTYIYIVTNSVAERRGVKVGVDAAGLVEVLEGVTEGQQVLATNGRNVGERVRTAPARR